MPIDVLGQAVGSIVTKLGGWLPQPRFKLTRRRPLLLLQYVVACLDVLNLLYLDTSASVELSIGHEQRAGICWLLDTRGLSVCTSIESPENGPLTC